VQWLQSADAALQFAASAAQHMLALVHIAWSWYFEDRYVRRLTESWQNVHLLMLSMRQLRDS
jgi:hypothetical protein